MTLPNRCFSGVYRDRAVLVTGHTGFKGSWLALWLARLGARTTGLALAAATEPNHFALLDLDLDSRIADIRDPQAVNECLRDVRPEIVFHLAAQSLVRRSYADPVGTYATNILGTMHVLEACRATDSVRAVVVVTSDKVYENREWPWAYREADALGGRDPYSSSKACAEILTASHRDSFHRAGGQSLVASVRAGNVIGGGDWAEDRLIPDIARAAHQGRPVVLRNPQSVRPWQFVLESLSGYLLLGQRLLEGRGEFADAWNFGPAEQDAVEVLAVVEEMKRHWPELEYRIERDPHAPHEASLLKLDSSKARSRLGWKPTWEWRTAVAKTAAWYRAHSRESRIASADDLEQFCSDAAAAGCVWSGA